MACGSIRKLILLCAALMAAAMIPGSGAKAAARERLDTLWVSVKAPEGEEMPAEAVTWHKLGEKEYALFLPGGTDWKETRIWFTGIGEITADGIYAARTFQDRFLDPTKLLLVTVNESNYYWPQLYAKEDFKQAVFSTWQSTYARVMRILLGEETDPREKLRSMDAYAEQITDSAAMNFTRWPIKGGRNVKRTGLT